MEPLNEKHYQTYKVLRYQYFFENMDWYAWEVLVYFAKTKFESDGSATLKELLEKYPIAFELAREMFGYDNEHCRWFVTRFNLEFYHDFCGLTTEQAKLKILKILSNESK